MDKTFLMFFTADCLIPPYTSLKFFFISTLIFLSFIVLSCSLISFFASHLSIWSLKKPIMQQHEGVDLVSGQSPRDEEQQLGKHPMSQGEAEGEQ